MAPPTKKNHNKSKMEKGGEEDPTEFIDASASEHCTSGQVAITVASPESNYMEDEPIPAQYMHEPKRRCWRLLTVGVIVAVGCGLVAGFYVKAQKQQEASSPMACAEDLQRCPDQSFVARDPLHNCEFHPCRPSGMANQQALGEQEQQISNNNNPMVPPSGIANEQAMFAEEGSSREEDGSCQRETKMCTDLSTVTRVYANDCRFEACPEGACWTDTRTCADGTTKVGRDPQTNCEFKACPTLSCGIGYQPLTTEWSVGCQLCPPGSYKANIGPESCSPCEAGSVQPLQGQGTCDLCPTGTMANSDTQSCDDGVAQQGSSCPPGINPREIKLCDDLSTVTRNGPNCEFAPCP